MIGQLIGNYRVTRQLGQGGMGLVFEAVHEQIKRRAAIKILHQEYSRSPEVIRRFFNEALAVNVVQHPSIVGVFESGQLPDGAAFIVMELLDGETLSSCLNKGVFKESDALLLIRQIASALAATHAKDIVHRDLKSDNVMLVKDPEVPGGRRVKILDFGLAKIAEKHQSNAVQTKDGVIMGTPSYMPPEQWMSATMVDAKSDVYSLGVMFFEMLTGRCPFLGDNINQLMMGHMYEDPPLVTRFEKSVSAGTEQLINQMLTKTRTARPAMIDVSARIEQLLAAPVPAPQGPSPQSVKPRDVTSAPTILQGAPSPLAQPQGPLAWTNMHIDTKVPDSGPAAASPPPPATLGSPSSEEKSSDAITVIAAQRPTASPPDAQPKSNIPNALTIFTEPAAFGAQRNPRIASEPGSSQTTAASSSAGAVSTHPSAGGAKLSPTSPLLRYGVLAAAVLLAMLLAILLAK